MSLNRALDAFEASITPDKPFSAYLGAFIAGAFQIVVPTNPALAYVRHLNDTPTTAKHRNRVDLTTLDQNTPIALYYDEYGDLAIWGLEPKQAGATLQTNPAAGSGGVKSVVAGVGVTVDNTDPVNPIVNAPGTGGALYVETTGVSIANDTTPTSLYAAGVGSRDLAANALTVGYTLEYLIGGLLTTAAVSPGTVEWRVGFASVVVIATGAIAIDANLNTTWLLKAWLTCTVTGASGTLSGGLELLIPGSVVAPIFLLFDFGTVDTTILETAEILFAFDTADPDNTLSSSASAFLRALTP